MPETLVPNEFDHPLLVLTKGYLWQGFVDEAIGREANPLGHFSMI